MIRPANFVLRLIVGGIFLLLGAIKVFEPAAFAGDIANYRIPPYELANLVAIVLPWIEVVAGLCLIMGVWARPAALVVALLCVVFGVAVSQAMLRGLDIRCGCFGRLGSFQVGSRHLVFDGALFAAALWLLLTSKETDKDRA